VEWLRLVLAGRCTGRHQYIGRLHVEDRLWPSLATGTIAAMEGFYRELRPLPMLGQSLLPHSYAPSSSLLCCSRPLLLPFGSQENELVTRSVFCCYPYWLDDTQGNEGGGMCMMSRSSSPISSLTLSRGKGSNTILAK
jgi:hypothetical protein